MNATPAGLPTVKSTIDRVVTTLSGETTPRTSDAHLVLDPVSSRVTVDPLTTTSDMRIALPPVLATTDSTIDLKPVAVDGSVRVVLGALPPTEVRTPYEHTWSWSLFGQELFSFTVRGESVTHVTPLAPDLAPAAGLMSSEYAGQPADGGRA